MDTRQSETHTECVAGAVMIQSYGSSAVGVFRDRSQALKALYALLNARFGENEVHLIGKDREGRGIDAGAEIASLGLHSRDHNFYVGEVSSGHQLVTVKSDGCHDRAWAILSNYGAYDYVHDPAELCATTLKNADAKASYEVGSQNLRFQRRTPPAELPSDRSYCFRVRKDGVRGNIAC